MWMLAAVIVGEASLPGTEYSVYSTGHFILFELVASLKLDS